MRWSNFAAVLVLASPAASLGAGVIRIDDEKSLFVTVGLRASAGAASSAGPSTYDISLDGAILSLGGQYNPTLKVSLNGGRAPTGELRIFDAIGMWEPKDYLKLWVGRFLVPTDRATLTGPFFGLSWDAPLVAAYPAAVVGRSDGLTLWGHFFEGKLKYYAGLFRRPDVLPTKESDLHGTGRIAFSLIGAEPAFYSNGSFFGSRDVLTIAAGFRIAPQSVGPVDARGNLWGWNVDAFFEKSFGAGGVLTAEAGLFRYYPSIAPSAAVPGGTATYEQLGWMPPFELMGAKLQLAFRHQHLYSGRGDRLDGTVNVLGNGHFLRFALSIWGEVPGTVPVAAWGGRLGAQLIL
jgi:hypothetical protein